MKTLARDFLAPTRLCRGGAYWLELAADLAREGLPPPGSRELGEVVTDHRTSWVRRIQVAGTGYHVKTYDYPGPADWWRGALRNTWLLPSRAEREWLALAWLGDHGVLGPRPVAVAEWRRRGWLRRAVLVTETWPGRPVDQLLLELDAQARSLLLGAVLHFVRELHRAGFRDGNLDARNLLARRSGDGSWQVAKVDSPRWRLCRPGERQDCWARADWRRLLPQLQQPPPPSDPGGA